MTSVEQQEQQEKAKKELEKFKTAFEKLMGKHPNIVVSCDVRGHQMACHLKVYNCKICLD